MVAHTHDDDRITFGCPGCIARAEQARIDNAPLRRVTWHCDYVLPDDDEPAGPPRSLSFTLEVKVPDGWGADKVDEHYAGRTGEAFAMALPDSVPMNDTAYACESMEVIGVQIGNIVADAPVPQTEQLPL